MKLFNRKPKVDNNPLRVRRDFNGVMQHALPVCPFSLANQLQTAWEIALNNQAPEPYFPDDTEINGVYFTTDPHPTITIFDQITGIARWTWELEV